MWYKIARQGSLVCSSHKTTFTRMAVDLCQEYHTLAMMFSQKYSHGNTIDFQDQKKSEKWCECDYLDEIGSSLKFIQVHGSTFGWRKVSIYRSGEKAIKKEAQYSSKILCWECHGFENILPVPFYDQASSRYFCWLLEKLLKMSWGCATK